MSDMKQFMIHTTYMMYYLLSSILSSNECLTEGKEKKGKEGLHNAKESLISHHSSTVQYRAMEMML
jgi:hypothetical protein